MVSVHIDFSEPHEVAGVQYLSINTRSLQSQTAGFVSLSRS